MYALQCVPPMSKAVYHVGILTPQLGESSLENMCLEVCSWHGAIQIHVYLKQWHITISLPHHTRLLRPILLEFKKQFHA